jgi:hypothetical protein
VILSFTGCRPTKTRLRGMTDLQRAVVANLLVERQPDKVVHGDCVGSDEVFAELVHELLGVTQILYPGYPPGRPDDFSQRAWVDRRWPDECFVQPAKPFLERDTDIVLAGEFLLATPRGTKELTYSGTWSTIRRARKHGRRHSIVYPDGSLHNVSGYSN